MFQGGGTTSGGDGVAGFKGAKATSASSQLLQMQRMLAAGQRAGGGRSANYFNDGANFGDLELSRQLQQQQQHRSLGPGGWGREGRDEFLATPSSGPYFGHGQAGAGMRIPPGDYFGTMSVAGVRGYVFKCPDCAFNKNSCEDLEIHIKTEHLNWLPFQCPFCQQNRASDSQMREHIHSVHKKPENKYFYVDNVVAKRMLQEMIDRALFSTSVNVMRSSRANGAYVGGGALPFAGAANGMFSNPFSGPNNNSNNNNSLNNNDYFMNGIGDSGHSPNNNNSGRGHNNNNDGGGSSAASPARKQPRQSLARPASHDINDDRQSNHSASQHSDEYGDGAGVTVVAKKTSNGEDLLAQLQQQLARSRHGGGDGGGDENDGEAGGSGFFGGGNGEEDSLLDDETSAQLSQIFGASRGLDLAGLNNDGGAGTGGADLADLGGLNFGGNRQSGDYSGASDDNDAPAEAAGGHASGNGGGGSGSKSSHNDVLQNLSAIFSAAANGGGLSMAADALKLADAGGSLFGGGAGGAGGSGGQSPIRFNQNNNPIRRRAPRGCGSNQSISKKRVLGECASCHKPITAGARQMHMFYHLGKDHNTYRFRCKHENCDVEHYRKDQMENHHSKVHGKIEAEMMEDRSLELYDMCQKMSMELLGTVGNTPGPTAAKAQILYDNMQREAEMAAFRKRKRNRSSAATGAGGASLARLGGASAPFFRPGQSARPNHNNNNNNNNNNNHLAQINSNHNSSTVDNNNGRGFNNNNRSSNNNKREDNNMDGVNADFIRSIQQQLNNQRSTTTTTSNLSHHGSNNNSYGSSRGYTGNNNNGGGNNNNVVRTAPVDSRHEESIECQRCRKSIVGRTRGFHILWHLNTDLGIIRYACTQCDFKHDRPQSVSTHGKKEHNDEDCVRDLINNFEDQVKSMSKACFGREQLFAKEERRRRSIGRALAEQESAAPAPAAAAAAESAGAAVAGSEDDDEEGAESGGDAEDAPPSMVGLAPSGAQPSRNVVKISLSKMSSALANGSSGPSAGTSAGSSSSKRKSSSRRFGIRRPKSRKQREEMAKLREVSMRLGGAQYFKKRSSESVACEKCGKYNTTRLSHHAYNHLEDCSLYLCPQCNMGHCSRDIIVKHLKDFHDSVEPPTDNRLKYAREIKEMIRQCYPSCFVDAPIPTPADIERLKANLKLSDRALATFDNENENENDNDNGNETENENDNDENEDDGMEDEADRRQLADEEDPEDQQEAQENLQGVEESHEDQDEDVEEEESRLNIDEQGDESADSDEVAGEPDDDEPMDTVQLESPEEDLQEDAPSPSAGIGLETEDDY